MPTEAFERVAHVDVLVERRWQAKCKLETTYTPKAKAGLSQICGSTHCAVWYPVLCHPQQNEGAGLLAPGTEVTLR